MNQTDRPIANPLVVLQEEFDDWAILFNPDTAAAVGINPIGVAVWKMMDGKRRVKEIVLEIKANFADASVAAFEEIVAFVDKLAEYGYVGYELKDNHR
ncbi:pyrroloquinoline quinone biosynthesis protein D [Gammaproteobacteria bacterium]